MTTRSKTRRIHLTLPALAILTAVVVIAAPQLAGAQGTAAGEVTFTKHIAPILQRSCQNCHRPDGGAPMSLLTYEEVRPWARSIKNRTELRNTADAMPPWYIEKDIGIQDFKGDVSLSDAEVENIAAWVDNGAPRGNPADMPPPLTFVDASLWQIGEPDMIVSSPNIEVGASDPDWWGHIGESETGLTEDRYVAAVEMKEVNNREPTTARATVGSRFAIHHLVWSAVHDDQLSPEEMQRLRTEDPDEFERVAAESVGQGFWPVHEVGRNADYFDPKAGMKLKAGSRLAFTSAHIHSTGSHTTTRLDIAFKFHPRGYKPEYTNQPLFAGTLNIDVKGNTANQKIESFQTMRRNAKLTLFEPHLHAAGVRMCLDAIYPNGLSETLSCSGYNHSWVRAYPYADHAAPLIPKDTILRVTGYFDTTAANKNVADGRNWSGLGHRSIDQMLINLTQGVYLTEEQFAQELAERRQVLNLQPGEYVLGCPGCSDIPVETSADQDQQ
jgi:mono/diheme cytochrome c family protein